jgi:hypothetical protein
MDLCAGVFTHVEGFGYTSNNFPETHERHVPLAMAKKFKANRPTILCNLLRLN